MARYFRDDRPGLAPAPAPRSLHEPWVDLLLAGGRFAYKGDGFTRDGLMLISGRAGAGAQGLCHDAEPRFVTPRQRAILGWCNLALIPMPLAMLATWAGHGFRRGKHTVDLHDRVDAITLPSFLVAWLPAVIALSMRLRIAMKIDHQYHSQEYFR